MGLIVRQKVRVLKSAVSGVRGRECRTGLIVRLKVRVRKGVVSGVRGRECRAGLSVRQKVRVRKGALPSGASGFRARVSRGRSDWC